MITFVRNTEPTPGCHCASCDARSYEIADISPATHDDDEFYRLTVGRDNFSQTSTFCPECAMKLFLDVAEALR